MSWDKTINALSAFLMPIGKYLGMWVLFAILGALLILGGFGIGFNESRLQIKEGLEILAIVVGFAFTVIATWLFKVKLEKMNARCDHE